MEILKLENTKDKIKNSRDGFNKRVKTAEEKINEREV